jgi:hypothetical protein
MPFWTLPSAAEEPTVTLTHWRIIETVDATRYLVGADSRDTGRVSSEIVSFDRNTLSAITSSGRRYRLVGNSGSNSTIDYVLQRWLKLNDDSTYRDVTTEMLAEK